MEIEHGQEVTLPELCIPVVPHTNEFQWMLEDDTWTSVNLVPNIITFYLIPQETGSGPLISIIGENKLKEIKEGYKGVSPLFNIDLNNSNHISTNLTFADDCIPGFKSFSGSERALDILFPRQFLIENGLELQPKPTKENFFEEGTEKNMESVKLALDNLKEAEKEHKLIYDQVFYEIIGHVMEYPDINSPENEEKRALIFAFLDISLID